MEHRLNMKWNRGLGFRVAGGRVIGPAERCIRVYICIYIYIYIYICEVSGHLGCYLRCWSLACKYEG